MKTLIIMLIAGTVFSQLGISADTSSENSAARDLAAAKSLAFGGVGVAGLMLAPFMHRLLHRFHWDEDC